MGLLLELSLSLRRIFSMRNHQVLQTVQQLVTRRLKTLKLQEGCKVSGSLDRTLPFPGKQIVETGIIPVAAW